ncbi:MAG: membrane protein insertion efficiency factor YidD [Phycisphaerales bacterium]|jgi:hypothetical protein|nr:membrane protein insertion efficiency factor YidD [Phycisphaerales bacterium]
MQDVKKVTLLAKLLILPVKLYQITLRPFLGGQCRFEPTCSDYSIEAFRKHGAWKGLAKTIYRILRCNPFGGSGYDPP